jgi:hypothetical protein
MPFRRRTPDQAARQPIKASTINRIAAEARRAGDLSVAGGVLANLSNGPQLRIPLAGLIHARASGGITGRVGDVPGAGFVNLEMYDAGADGLVYDTFDRPVRNRWAGSVADTKLCVVYRVGGVLWILNWEC